MSEDQQLPLHFEHSFEAWSYSKSHRTLVLRGYPGKGHREYVDIVFSSVLGMKIASGYERLSVHLATDSSEMDEFLRNPERYDRGYLNVVVSDGGSDGYVVCKNVKVRRGTRRYEEEGESDNTQGS
ncbi:hypothetical protein GCM10010441_67210 [Kitasatospora paracochleata]|uniref:Uncharacterized protein n=1 Tax=Kitasatospora paracochleata TaxID=58354 RepID=A0ABT1J0A1_9ACTN|nr:hypothetical protein [Kitasatospora paracochleata]MCP2310853.1 hypothetical protein [Kitasatospora paracochleata]